MSSSLVAWPTNTGSEKASHALRAALYSCVVCFTDQVVIHVAMEEEVARLRQEKERLSQELTGALESGRRAGGELGRKDRELTGNVRRLVICCLPPLCLFFFVICQK